MLMGIAGSCADNTFETGARGPRLPDAVASSHFGVWAAPGVRGKAERRRGVPFMASYEAREDRAFKGRVEALLISELINTEWYSVVIL